MKLKINHFFILIFAVFNGFVQAQINSVNTANVDFRFSDGKVFITYDIVSSAPNELYNITVSVFRENGAKLNALSVGGDIKEVAGGNGKIIVWEQKKDGYVLDEKIYISLAIATQVSIPVVTHLLKSAVVPGWGDYKIRNGKYHFLYGVAGLGAIGASIYMNSQAQKNYTNYKKSFDFNESNNLFNKAKQQQNLSYIFAGGACLVWTIDLACLYGKTNKVKKQITEENSKYYYQKSQQTNLFTSKTDYINTKSPYDLAIERGDKLFSDEKYEEAKIAYEEANKYEATETSSNKLASINKIIEEDKAKTKSYNSIIVKGQELLAQKQYKEAKAEFESASGIKPKEKYPVSKIDEINSTLNQIENQRLYNEQMEQGIALLKNKNCENAKTNFKTALKYKPNDVAALNKINECDNGIEIEEQKKVDSEYKQKMAQANTLLATKRYEDAKAICEQASQLKPDEVEPINKIDACIDAIAKIEEAKNNAEYKKAMAKADNAWGNKKYDEAKIYYETANRLKPEESLPQIRLEKIRKMSSEDVSAPKNSQADLVAKYTSAILYIVNSNGFKSVQGSGFIVSSDGIAISNYHVFKGMDKTKSKITFENGDTYGVKEVLEKSEEDDYIIFRLDCPSYKKFNYLKYSTVEPKKLEEVFTIGSPDGIGFIAEDGKIITVTEKEIYHNVNITHGNSGGPLINSKGEVIGITSGGIQSENREYKFAKKISLLRLSRWISN